MSDTDDHGFQIRNSETDESWQQAQAEARMAARREPAATTGDVGQGAGRQQDTTGPFDPAKLGDHAYYQAHKTEILAAAAAGELPGQPNATN